MTLSCPRCLCAMTSAREMDCREEKLRDNLKKSIIPNDAPNLPNLAADSRILAMTVGISRDDKRMSENCTHTFSKRA